MASCDRCAAPLPEGARFCPACGAEATPTAAAEERKVATVLFADLVGSTALASAEDPERIRAVLERFYDAMAAEILRAGGTVEKFAGDAVMAVFGAPAALEDHAERALHASLAMRRRLAELYGDGLQLRIGVNTGEIVVGRAREGSSFVSGDAVNVCARLEQNVDPGQILVGARTAAAARGAFEFGEATRIDAKGKPEGVECRLLLRALSLMRPRGAGDLRRVFVGRDAELGLLQATYQRVVAAGEPHLVTVVGEPGVGKSRLVRELWEWLGGLPSSPVRRTGRCLAYGQGITYWPLGEILREHFGLLESDSPEVAADRLGDRNVLGLALGLDVGGGAHPRAVRDRLHDAWLDFLRELARERPAVLLVEDLHWAEEPLLDLVERSAREAEAPVLLIGTARPEFLDRRPGWGGGPRNVTSIWLQPLAAAEAAEMVAGLLAAELPARVREAVVAQADGNPFFVEELVATLIDQSILFKRNGGWAVGDLGEALVLPDSIQGVLAARIDLLAPAEKAALQAAAVIGRVFWERPVRELIDFDDVELGVLEDRDLIRRRHGSAMAGDREYAIKHALTREVAYASVPKAKRARLHAAFGRWLERLEQRDELAPLLAHHYAQAVRPEEADLAWAVDDEELRQLRAAALAWLRRAAEQATARYELADAVRMLESALELVEPGDERAAVWRGIGHAYALGYAGEKFWTALQHAIDEARDATLRSDLHADLAFETATKSGIWQRIPDAEVVDGWIDRALESAGPTSASRAKALVARARWNPSRGREAAIEASAIAERLADPVLRSAAWDARGIAEFVDGEFDHGRAWAERRFELLDQISDPDARAEIYSAPITGCVWTGRFREARRLARAHDEIASTLTPHHRLHGVAIEIEVEELLGRWDRVRDRQERAERAVAENLDTPCVRNPRSLLVCALAAEHLGDADETRRLEKRAREIWMEGYGATLDTPRLALATARGDVEEAGRLLGLPDTAPGWHRGWFVFANVVARLDALAALGDRDRVETEAEPHTHRPSYLEPFALRALGRVREDERLLAQAAARFDDLDLDWHAAQTRALLQ